MTACRTLTVLGLPAMALPAAAAAQGLGDIAAREPTPEEGQVHEGPRQDEAQLIEARQALAGANQSIQDLRRGRAPSSSGGY